MATSKMEIDPATAHHNPLMSTFPVFVPHLPELFFDNPSFNDYLQQLSIKGKSVTSPEPVNPSPFMDALNKTDPTLPANLMYTDNGAITNESSKSPLLDLFTELERVISDERLETLLPVAWAEDPDITLKVIWNARSIHNGKGDKMVFYRCLGWLRDHHPRTLLENLDWLVRPVALKKLVVEKEGEEGTVVVEMKDVVEVDEDDVTRFDVKDGGAHGYWADLLHVLHLAVQDKLLFGVDPAKQLFPDKAIKDKKVREDDDDAPSSKRRKTFKKGEEPKEPTETAKEKAQRLAQSAKNHRQNILAQKQAAKDAKHQKEKKDHDNFLAKFNDDQFYRALHLKVARIFVEQIQRDEAVLQTGKNLGSISYAAKWAPSLEKMHDRSTFVATTMAELMFSPEKLGLQEASREDYLKHARQHYRRHLAALRKSLDIVETKITEKRFQEIHYKRVPSIAMNRYKNTFAKKDLEHFEGYLDDVALGKSTISGAVLLPSVLVHQCQETSDDPPTMSISGKAPKDAVDRYVKAKIAVLVSRVVDAQWNTLVQRIRDSGTLENAIAVVDVSGSMLSPSLSDGTCPMDSAIGLGLLVAQVAKAPFNNSFITFSSTPAVVKVDPSLGLSKVVSMMKRTDWSMNTDFNAVFEKLLLPIAVNNKLKPEDMVKRIFVFSDMQFDHAGGDSYDTNHERIKKLFEEAGYELPELVYWNLAGGRDGTAPKAVTKDTTGAAMVSGYSQGMLKLFLENGVFEEVEGEDSDDDDEEEMVGVGKEGEEVAKPVTLKKKKTKIDPLAVVMKSVGHESYRMLKVVD